MDFNSKEIFEMEKKYVLVGLGYEPTIMVEGDGAVFRDIEGNEYIDFFSQAVVTTVGDRHPKIMNAVKKQMEKAIYFNSTFINIPRTIYAKKLAENAPNKLKNNCKVFVTSGGAMANEGAIKFSILTTKKNEVISTYRSYHGATIGLMSLQGSPWYLGDVSWPKVPGFFRIPNSYCYRCWFGKEYPECDLECARALEDSIKYGSMGNVAAFIQEAITGNGGHQTPPKEYFKIIAETCKKYGIIYIIDEVQTGFGRTGKFWACDYFDIDADIVTCGKGAGGGFNTSAFIIRDVLIPPNLKEKMWHSHSFSGTNLCDVAAGSALIDLVVESKLYEEAARKGLKITNRLNEMMEQYPIIGEIRGPGLFIGVELIRNKKTKEPAIEEALRIHKRSFREGLFIGVNQVPGKTGNILKIKPPLTIADEQIDEGLEILEGAIKKQKFN